MKTAVTVASALSLGGAAGLLADSHASVLANGSLSGVVPPNSIRSVQCRAAGVWSGILRTAGRHPSRPCSRHEAGLEAFTGASPLTHSRARRIRRR